jgi:transposase InsO family protein
MPWKEVSTMTERARFIADYERGLHSMAELCRRYGISRTTGYKLVHRFYHEGPLACRDRSRRPRTSPTKTPERIVDEILEARRRHPTWGPKKLLVLLARKHPGWPWPARSTTADILKRHGLVPSRRRRRSQGHSGRPDTPMTQPNEIWTIDFKGHFRTRDGKYCYPLTVADGYSRYLLGCRAFLSPCYADTKKALVAIFRQHGLPSIIRSDNGTPFASSAIGRISRLSVWWISLGIFPELIEPAHPEQNGRHERMHRTLKAEATRPPAANRRAQQRRFNRFQRTYNQERPHEALGQKTPASVYQASSRSFVEHPPSIEYPSHYEVRRVSNNGGIRWNSNWVNVSHVLGGEYIGLEEVDNQLWDVYLGPLHLGRFSERDMAIEDALGRKRRRRVSTMSSD